ncbi:extensin-like [Penaeus monodon]|uniref:extensin-like n=1 Tax=Penaeus monodon TaxID=6687 RepID=UPI0018A76C2C|nr:extensin-like [Penaeus monodon]
MGLLAGGFPPGPVPHLLRKMDVPAPQRDTHLIPKQPGRPWFPQRTPILSLLSADPNQHEESAAVTPPQATYSQAPSPRFTESRIPPANGGYHAATLGRDPKLLLDTGLWGGFFPPGPRFHPSLDNLDAPGFPKDPQFLSKTPILIPILVGPPINMRIRSSDPTSTHPTPPAPPSPPVTEATTPAHLGRDPLLDRGVFGCGFPPGPGSPLLRQPGRPGLPKDTHFDPKFMRTPNNMRSPAAGDPHLKPLHPGPSSRRIPRSSQTPPKCLRKKESFLFWQGYYKPLTLGRDPLLLTGVLLVRVSPPGPGSHPLENLDAPGSPKDPHFDAKFYKKDPNLPVLGGVLQAPFISGGFLLLDTGAFGVLGVSPPPRVPNPFGQPGALASPKGTILANFSGTPKQHEGSCSSDPHPKTSHSPGFESRVKRQPPTQS